VIDRDLSIPVFRGLTLLELADVQRYARRCCLSIPVFRGLTLLEEGNCSASSVPSKSFNPRF
jgi:hypothetical protein